MNPIKVIYNVAGSSKEEVFKPMFVENYGKIYIDIDGAFRKAIEYAESIKEKGNSSNVRVEYMV